MNAQSLADRLATALSDKGYEKPDVRVTCNSGDVNPDIGLIYYIAGQMKNPYFWSHSKDPVVEAWNHVNELPPAESVMRKAAFEQLSKAVEIARKNGLDFLFEMKTDNLLPAE